MWILYPEKLVLCVGWTLQSLGLLEVVKAATSGVPHADTQLLVGQPVRGLWVHSPAVRTNKNSQD